MYKIVLCHRVAEGVSRRELDDHWEGPRRRLLLELRPDLGFEDLFQTLQLRRRNLIYRGIRASRSWLATTLFAAAEGQQVGPKPDRHTVREERWDVVEELSYPSREALVQALAAAPGREAARRLVEDQRPWTRRTAVMVAEVFPVIPAEGPPFPRINTLFFLRARPPKDRQQMLDYWGTSHKKFFLSLKAPLGYAAYEQMHVRDGADLSPVIEALGGSVGEQFDGVAKVAYAGQGTLVRGFLSLRTQIANVKLIRDEVTFIDGGRSSLVLGTEDRFPAPSLKGDPS